MAKPKRTVLAAAEESSTPPNTLDDNQSLARVIKAEGHNHYSCELPNGKPVIVELAQRFRNTIWIRRGGYVLLQRYDSQDMAGRVVGEIVNVVRDEKTWRKMPYWPAQFVSRRVEEDDSEDESNVGKMPPSDSEDES